MEFLTILIIFAILSRIIEAIGGGAKKGPGTRPPRPQQRMPQQRQRHELPRGGEEDASESPAAARPQDAAADMIPDELWELLTGQKRQRPAAPPAPARAPARLPPSEEDEVEAAPRAEVDEEAAAEEYVRSHRRDESSEVAAVLDQQKKVLARRAPDRVSQVVSLEVEPLPERERHRRFHAKVDAPVKVTAKPAPPAQRLGLSGPGDLRRAFILREVLGPPRGLEDDPLDR